MQPSDLCIEAPKEDLNFLDQGSSSDCTQAYQQDEPVIQQQLSRHTKNVVIDPFKVYHDEVVKELLRLQNSQFPHKKFPRLADEILN